MIKPNIIETLEREGVLVKRNMVSGPTYLKIGRLVKYTQADLDAWLQSRGRQSTSDTGAGR